MCNSWNHSPACTCGFGGEGHSGRSYSGRVASGPTIRTGAAQVVLHSSSWWDVSGAYDSYVNPNAHCPVCGESVIFYQSPYGGRVFFDHPLGSPWPKHPCTDNSTSRTSSKKGRQRSISSSLARVTRQRIEQQYADGAIPQTERGGELSGWKPFVCLYQKTIDQSTTEVWGQVLTRSNNVTKSLFITAQAESLELNLRDAPVFVKELDRTNGSYELSTFALDYELEATEIEITPIMICLSSARPIPTRGGAPLCPLCGIEAKDLRVHVSRLHTGSTVRNPLQAMKQEPRKRKATCAACPVCKTKIGSGRMYDHLLRLHNRNPTLYGYKLRPGVATCPLCKSQVRLVRMANHILRIHNKNPVDYGYGGRRK